MIIKRAETIDGVAVYATADGDICDGTGRTFGRVRLPLHAALMVVGEADLAFAFEVAALVKAAARLLRTDRLLPGTLRREAFRSSIVRRAYGVMGGWCRYEHENRPALHRPGTATASVSHPARPRKGRAF